MDFEFGLRKTQKDCFFRYGWFLFGTIQWVSHRRFNILYVPGLKKDGSQTRAALMDRSIAVGSSFPSGSNSILQVKGKSRTSV